MSTDFAHNRELAFRAKMSLTHPRTQRMVTNWLLKPEYSQTQADYAAQVMKTAAQCSDVDISEVGSWDVLGHSMLLSFMQHEWSDWLVHQSGFFDSADWQHIADTVSDVFGPIRQGIPYVVRFDNEGRALLVDGK